MKLTLRTSGGLIGASREHTLSSNALSVLEADRLRELTQAARSAAPASTAVTGDARHYAVEVENGERYTLAQSDLNATPEFQNLLNFIRARSG